MRNATPRSGISRGSMTEIFRTFHAETEPCRRRAAISAPEAIQERIIAEVKTHPPKQGDGIRETPDGLPDEGDHAPVHRYAMEGKPPRDGPSQGGDRPAGIRSEGSGPGVPERGLRHVHGHDHAASRRIPSRSSAWSRSAARKRWSGSRRSSGRITSCPGERTPRRRRRSNGMRQRSAGMTRVPAEAGRSTRSAAAVVI